MLSKILFIEDEGPLRENVAELLSLKGYQVVTASDGRQGISLALLEEPDLILCDIMMPRQDGYQVLDAIRKSQSLASTPFIFLTAKAQLADLRQGMNLGADDYLTKPFISSDLIAAIESRLVRERGRLAHQQQPANYLTTIRGRDGQGYMTLHAQDCLYFFVRNSTTCVLHASGTFQIDRSLEELTARLDPVLFFRANRNAIVHRKIVQKYAYWEKGKYCLYLSVDSPLRQVVLPRARYSPFKDWLSYVLPSPRPTVHSGN
ncbi:MAG: response regulator [Bacteroidetes bacterium]|nr:response regulator [Fibrella sp.]